MENKSGYSYIIILLILLFAIYTLFDSRLVPAGYELAVDGLVISRTLMIIFILHLISKVAFMMISKSEEK
ncbi:hypothetical protein [Planomicrobium okeanokoites]|uniref:hypothetical protein n=1 Tax=Planomicrobium okeanokoites TaxID=244 RepID=UPI00356268F2